ncbi:MAG: hypothetical protein ACI3YK_02120 [Eubacteriales bacterium]
MGNRFDRQGQAERTYRLGICLLSAAFLILLLFLRLSDEQWIETESDPTSGLLFLSKQETGLSRELSDETLSALLASPGQSGD